jgi:hypothetical protein
MKDKCFIYYGNPCSGPLSDPAVQDFEDAMRQTASECPYEAAHRRCPPERLGCVRLAGARMARAVLQFYREASEHTLALDREFFRRRGPLPGKGVDAYIDPDRGFRRITDPKQAVQRVWEHARAVLDLRPAERVPRQVGHYTPPAIDIPLALLRLKAERPHEPTPTETPKAGRPKPRPWAPPAALRRLLT